MYSPVTTLSDVDNLKALVAFTYKDSDLQADLINEMIDYAVSLNNLRPKEVNDKASVELGPIEDIKENTYIYLTNPESGLDIAIFYNRLPFIKPEKFLYELWNPKTNRMEPTGALGDAINIREVDYNNLSQQTYLSALLGKHYQIIGSYPKDFKTDLGGNVTGTTNQTDVTVTIEASSLVYIPGVYQVEQTWGILYWHKKKETPSTER